MGHAVVDCQVRRKEYLVYRDRLVVERDQEFSHLRVAMYEAPPEAWAALVQALAEGRIDLASGDCRTDEFQPAGIYLDRIDWFGRGTRGSSFRVQDALSGFPPCSPELVTLRHAVWAYIWRALQQQPLSELELPRPAIPPCQ